MGRAADPGPEGVEHELWPARTNRASAFMNAQPECDTDSIDPCLMGGVHEAGRDVIDRSRGTPERSRSATRPNKSSRRRCESKPPYLVNACEALHQASTCSHARAVTMLDHVVHVRFGEAPLLRGYRRAWAHPTGRNSPYT
jgi:hypothetical protein